MPILTFVRKTGFLSLIFEMRTKIAKETILLGISQKIKFVIVKRKELLSELTKFILFSLMNACGVTLQQ